MNAGNAIEALSLTLATLAGALIVVAAAALVAWLVTLAAECVTPADGDER